MNYMSKFCDWYFVGALKFCDWYFVGALNSSATVSLNFVRIAGTAVDALHVLKIS